MYKSYLQRVATYMLPIEAFVSEIILKLLITGLVPRPKEDRPSGLETRLLHCISQIASLVPRLLHSGMRN